MKPSAGELWKMNTLIKSRHYEVVVRTAGRVIYGAALLSNVHIDTFEVDPVANTCPLRSPTSTNTTAPESNCSKVEV